MALTKKNIATQIQDELGFPKNRSVELTETPLEIIKASLESGEDVLASGFGKFCVKEKRERRGRNPATGEDAIPMAAERRPDLVLMDIRLNGDMDGITAARTIRARYGTPVIYLTAHADDATIERVVRQMRQSIQDELGLPASAGVAASRPIAKMASGSAKPAGVLMVRIGREHEFVADLPVRRWPGS